LGAMTPRDVGQGLAERGDEAVHGLGVDRERGGGPDDAGPGLRRQEPARHAPVHHRSRPSLPDGRADQQAEPASRILEAGAPDGPTPVWTSPKSSSAPRSSHSSRACRTNAGSSGTTPPSPSTGSISTAAVPVSTARSSASGSLGSTCTNPSGSGWNGACFSG